MPKTMRFGIDFDVNKKNLDDVKKSLQEIQNMSVKDMKLNLSVEEGIKRLSEIKKTAAEVQAAVTKSYNSDLGVFNTSKFNEQIKKIGIERISRDFAAMGEAGAKGFNRLAAEVLTTNTQLKQTNSFIDSIQRTLGNTIKWNIASSAVNSFTYSIQSAFGYVKALDQSLTDIRIVTGQSREEMARFGAEANKTAQSLRRNTKDYTKSYLTYVQQGLSQDESASRTEATLKATNVTGAQASQVANDLTAVWNGFKIKSADTTLAVDKLAQVADSSASNMSELAAGMSKVASVANNMGVSIDQVNAMLATTIATTRQAPETVGNAYKTIFARINDIKAGASDAEISLGNYSGRMKKVGIDVLDMNGHLRSTGDVMEEVGSKWGSLTKEQQTYLASTMAGQRQMNNLIALFDNWAQYQDLVNVSMNSAGALEQKNARYMESLTAHANNFTAALEGVQDSLIDEDVLKGIYTQGSNLLNLVNSFIQGIGGGKAVLVAFGAALTQIFSQQAQSGIVNFLNNKKQLQEMAEKRAGREEGYANLTRMSESAQGASQEVIGDSVEALIRRRRPFDSAIDEGLVSKEQSEAINAITEEQKAINDLNIELRKRLDLAKEYYDNYREFYEASDMGEAPEFERGYDVNKTDAAYGNVEISEQNKKAIQSQLDLLETLGEEFLQTEDKAESLVKALNKGEGYSEQAKKIEKLQKELAELNEETEEYLAKKAELEALEKKKEPTDEKIQDFLDRVVAQKESGGIRRETFLGNRGLSLIKDATDGQEAFEILSKSELPMSRAIELITQGIRGTREEVFELCQVLDTAEESAEQISQRTKEVKETSEKVEDNLDTKGLAKNITAIGVGVSQIAAGAVGLGGIAKTLKEMEQGSVSLGDGITRLGTSAVFVFPMLIDGFKRVNDGVKGVGGASVILSAAAKKLQELQGFLTSTTGVVTVGITGLLLLVAAAQRAATANQRATEAAKHNAIVAKDAYDSVRKSAEELKKSLDGLEKAQENIKNLAIGTQEWRDALIEANKQVLALISSYKELSTKVKIDDNGLMSFDAQTLKEIQEKSRQGVATALVGATSQQTNVTKDSIRNQEIALANKTNIDSDVIRRTLQIMSKDSLFLDRDTKSVMAALGTESADVAKALIANKDAIKEAAPAIQANVKALELNSQAMVSTYNESHKNKKYDAVDNKQALNAMMAAALNDTDDYWKKYGQLKNKKAAAEEYAELYGWTVTKRTGKAVNFKDQNGNEHNDIDYKIIKDTLVRNSQLQEASSKIDDYVAALNKLTNAGSAVAGDAGKEAFTSFAGGNAGNFGALTKTQFEDIKKAFEHGDFDSIFNENFKEVGFSSGQAFKESFSLALKESDNGWASVGEGLTGAVKDAFNSISKDDFSLATKQNLEKALSDSFLHGGQKGLKAFQDLFAQSKDSAKLTEVFSSIDWTQSGALNDLQKELEKQGITVDTTSSAWKEFAAALNAASSSSKNSLSSLEGVTSSLSAIKAISGKATGEIIDEKTYETLVNANRAASQFFTTTVDGKYKLIGSSEELKKLFDDNANSLENIKKKIQEIGDFSEKFKGLNVKSTDTAEQADILKAVTAQENNSDVYGYLGVSRDALDEAATYIQQKQSELRTGATTQEELDSNIQYTNSLKILEDAYTSLAATISDYKNGIISTAAVEEQWVDANISSFDQLTEAYEKGTISAETYSKTQDEIINRELRSVGVTADVYDAYVDALKESSENLKEADDVTKSIALDNLKLNKGLESLSKNWEKNAEVLQKTSNILDRDYLEAMSSVKSSLEDVFGFKPSNKFIQDNLAEIQQLAEGNVAALDSLRVKAAQEIVASIRIDVDDSTLASQLQSELDYVSNFVANFDPGAVSIGAELDDTQFIDALDDMLYHSQMTQEQANQILEAIGYEPTISYVDGPPQHTKTETDISANLFGNDVHVAHLSGDTQTVVQVPQIDGGSGKHGGRSGNGTGPKFKGSGGSRGGTNIVSAGNAGGGKGGGKGGGGGKEDKPSDNKKDHLEPLEKEVDIYHDINRELDDLEEKYKKIDRILKRISGQEKYLTGAALIDNLQKQNQLLEDEQSHLQKQISKMKEKQALQRWDLEQRQAILKSLNITVDVNGDIIGYNNILIQQQAAINKLKAEENALIDQWNAAATGTQQEALQQQIEAKEKEISELSKHNEKVEKQMTEYESLRESMEDLDNSVDEAYDKYEELAEKQIENQIKSFNTEIKISLDLSEAERDWNEFQKKVVDRVADKDFLGLAKARVRDFESYYNAEETGEVQSLMKHLEDTRAELQTLADGGHSDVYSSYNESTGKWVDDIASAQKDLKEYADKLAQSLQDVEEIAADVHENVMSQIDKENDAFEKQLDKYEQITNLIDHDKKLIKLVFGKDKYTELEEFFEKHVENNKSNLDFLKREREEWRRQAAEAKAQRDTQREGSKEWERYNEQYEKFYENFTSTTSKLNSAIEDSIDNAFQKWENAVNKIAKQTKAAFFGENGYDNSKTTWDKTKWHDKRYLDRLERAKELLEIEGRINKISNESTNVTLQNKLAAFRDKELETLSKKDHLTQADIEYANKKIDLIQKQMALEDAQNAKTQMRLRRDSQGNYSYQYVADENNIKDKMDAYQQALMELRKIPKEQLENTYDELYSKIDEFYSNLADLAEKHKGNQEEYAAAAKELYERYYGKDGFITLLAEEANTYQKNYNEATFLHLDKLQADEQQKFANFLGIGGSPEEQSLLGSIEALIGTDGRATELLEAFTNDIAEQKWNQLRDTQRKVLQEGDDSIESIWNNALKSMSEKYTQELIPSVEAGMARILEQNEIWHRNLEEIEAASGRTFSEVARGIDETVEETKALLENNQELINQYGEETDAVQAVEAALGSLIQSYDSVRNSAITAAQDAQQAWKESLGAFEEYQNAISGNFNSGQIQNSNSDPAASNPASIAGGDGSTGASGAASSSGGGSVDEATALGIAKNIWTYESWGTGQTRKNRIAERYNSETAARAQEIINEKRRLGRLGDLVDYNSRQWSFASGGYTGEWGTQGRLSVLHEKEYVLNKEDTPNVLTAVSVANRVMDKVRALGSTAFAALTGSSAFSFDARQEQNGLEQNVSIQVSFPNARDAAEIEKALNNLVNMASQRASKNINR